MGKALSDAMPLAVGPGDGLASAMLMFALVWVAATGDDDGLAETGGCLYL